MAHMSGLSLAAHLQSCKPPWTTLLVLKARQRLESLAKLPHGFVLRVISGAKCRRTPGLFAELAEVLSFPDYFGHNWDALEECLADLEWLPGKGYVLLFTNAELLLAEDEEEFATFLEVLGDAGEAWAAGQGGMRRATPFHAVLTISERDRQRYKHRGLPEVSVSPVRRPGKTRARRTSRDA